MSSNIFNDIICLFILGNGKRVCYPQLFHRMAMAHCGLYLMVTLNQAGQKL